MNASLVDKFVGSMLGLAVGDALGSYFEGQSPDWIGARYPTPDALVKHPPEAPWSYTDDAQMAIGVAEALIKDGEIVEASLCEAFVSNYVPSRGYGRGARVVLEAMEAGHDYKHWTNELFPGDSYGNGAAMRVAPVGLLFHEGLDRCWDQARLSSLPTHVHPLGIEGAQLIATAVSLCMRDQEFHKSSFYAELLSRSETEDFRQKLELAAQAKSIGELLPLGNGIAAQDSVVTAIACFSLWPDDYEQVITNAILLGGDTDTIAAMAGAISGARLGVDGIPSSFLDSLENRHKGRDYIRNLGIQLHEQFANRS